MLSTQLHARTAPQLTHVEVSFVDSESPFLGFGILGLQKPQPGMLCWLIKNLNWVWHGGVSLGSLEEGMDGWLG